MNPSRPHRSKADEITRVTRPGSESWCRPHPLELSGLQRPGDLV